MRKHALTNEQKTAVKITTLLDSVSLDLDRVGIEIARLRPSTSYNRLILVAEAAVEEQEKEVSNNGINYLF
jgi:D-alanyl-D-alanine dipeptidase